MLVLECCTQDVSSFLLISKAGQQEPVRRGPHGDAPLVRMELAWEFGYQPGRRNELEALTRGNRRTADSREDQEQGEDGQNIEADFYARGPPERATHGRRARREPGGEERLWHLTWEGLHRCRRFCCESRQLPAEEQ